MEELRGPERLMLGQLLWMVLSWTVHHSESPLWDPHAVEELELDLLSHPDPSLGQPTGLLTGFLAATPAPDSHQKVAWACLCVTEWASGEGFRFTAAEFAQAAAVAWKSNTRYACLAAELLHASGQWSKAKHWFRRTLRLAVWNVDRTCEVRARSGLQVIERTLLRADHAEDLRSRAVRDVEQRDVDPAGDPSMQAS